MFNHRLITRVAILLVIACTLLPSASVIAQSIDYLTTVILVRHAEREDGVDTLNEAGMERARELRRVLKNSDIDVIYASSFYRAQQTVQPLADALDMTLNIYDPRKLNELVYLISEKHKGETIVVAGHSNATPRTVNELGVTPAHPDLEHDIYDQMYIVTFSKHRTPKLLTLEYGKKSH